MAKIKKGWLLRDKMYKMSRGIFFYRPHAVYYAKMSNLSDFTEIVPVILSISLKTKEK